MSEKFVRYVNGGNVFNAALQVAKSAASDLWEVASSNSDLSPTQPGLNRYKVTVEQVEPEPEAMTKMLWDCQWHSRSGFQTRPAMSGTMGTKVEWSTGGEARNVMGQVETVSNKPPTLADFRAAVKDATGVEIPEPEQPKLWVWDVRDAEWSVHADSTSPPYAEVTTCGPNGTVANLYVTATTKTRDALRDEALSWAARAAGKDGEG